MSSSSSAIRTPSLSGCAFFATISIPTFARYRLVPMPTVAVMPVSAKNVPDHGDRHLVRRGDTGSTGVLFIKVQVSRHIDKTLVDAVNVDVIFADIFPVDLINLRGNTDVLCHAGRGSDVFDPRVVRCFIIPNLLFGFK